MMSTTACSTASLGTALPLPPPEPPERSRLFCMSSSKVVNTSQARRKGTGVFFSPMPMTVRPLSRRRLARRVKSESLDTRQKPSTLSVYKRSMASMIMAESVAFLPWV